MMKDEQIKLPVPLPLTWQLFDAVHCPQCNEHMHMRVIEPRENLEREAHCLTVSCPQSKVTYITRITVDGQLITGVKE